MQSICKQLHENGQNGLSVCHAFTYPSSSPKLELDQAIFRSTTQHLSFVPWLDVFYQVQFVNKYRTTTLVGR